MMRWSSRIRDEFSAWIALAAEATTAAISRISARPRIQLIETGRNSFTMRIIS